METVLFENEAQLLEQNEQPGNGQMTLNKDFTAFCSLHKSKTKTPNVSTQITEAV
jgi:hypothetical protein